MNEQQYNTKDLDDTVVNVDEDIDDLSHDNKFFDDDGF